MRTPLLLALLVVAASQFPGPPPVADQRLPPAEELVIELVARVDAAGRPATWTATARAVQDADGREATEPGVGACRPERPEPEPTATLPLDRVVLLGAVAGTLEPATTSGRWGTVGPRRAPDPGWGVGAVELRRGMDRVRVTDAVRLPGVPEITAVASGPDGSVTVTWREIPDELTLRAATPEGILRCGASESAAVIPPSLARASAGEVLLRATRTRETVLPGGLRLRVRASVDRVIHLDEPPQRAEERLPPPLSVPDRGPRHSGRRARPTYG